MTKIDEVAKAFCDAYNSIRGTKFKYFNKNKTIRRNNNTIVMLSSETILSSSLQDFIDCMDFLTTNTYQLDRDVDLIKLSAESTQTDKGDI